MKVLPLVGYKSLRALQAFHILMLGLKMLPDYLGETYEEFYERIKAMSEEDQRTMLVKAATFVPLDKEELEALICFCVDPNGVPYSATQIKSLSPDKLIEVIVAVGMEISKIKVDLVSEKEKKKSKTTQSISEKHS